MNNQENEDFEQVFTISENEDFNDQVFTIGEREDFRVEGEGSVLNSPPNSLPILVAFALVVFLPLAFVALVVGSIARTTTGIYYSDLAMPLSLGCVLVTYIAVNIYANSAPAVSKQPTQPHAKGINGKKKKKKFKNVQEHRMHLEQTGYDVDSDPRFQNIASQEPPVQINKKKVADEVELAVDALVKLGFGFKKAQDWVMRGITDGILTSDTQGLIRYALSKGASHQNRENK